MWGEIDKKVEKYKKFVWEVLALQEEMNENLDFLEQYIKENNLEAEIEVIGSRCENICTHGPNIIIDGVQYYGVDKKKLKELLNE